MTSQINPNNINGAYPVAGQDNNSQGFRDNFTNTITNFQYAKEEITALQNTAILQNQTNTIGNTIISGGVFRNTGGATAGSSTAGSLANVVYPAGPYQFFTFNSNVGTVALSAWPVSGTYASVRLELTAQQSNTVVTLPTSVGNGVSQTSLSYVKGANISARSITIDSTGTYVFEFWTRDSGSTVFINDLTRGANATPV